MRTLRTSRALAWVAASAICASVVAAAGTRTATAAGPTPGGTTITNSAQAGYTDALNHAYTVNSNQVFVYVQNVPNLTITTVNNGNAGIAAGYPVVPGALISDLYTLTNSGNTTAGGASGGGVALNATSVPYSGALSGGALATGVNYIVSLPQGGNLPTTGCNSTASPTFSSNVLATINTCLAAIQLAPGGGSTSSVNVAIQYQIPYNSSTGGNAGSTVNSTLTYASQGPNFPAQSSTNSAVYTDPVQIDARMDLVKSATVNGFTDLTYTVYANNGGSVATHYNNLANDLPGLTGITGAVAVVDPMPQFPAGTYLPPTQSATATIQNGALNGAQVQFATTTDPKGASNWTLVGSPSSTAATITASQYTGAALLAVIVINGTTSATNPIVSGGAVSCSTPQSPCGLVANSSASSNSGGVGSIPNTANAEIKLTFSVAQSTAPGSGDTNPYPYLNVADSLVATNANTPCFVGPGNPAAVSTSCGTGGSDGTQATAATIVTNTTPSKAPSGASNQTQNNSPALFQVLLGPVNTTTDTTANLQLYAGAQGAYSIAYGAANNNGDFTARGICWGAVGTGGTGNLNSGGTIVSSPANCPNPYPGTSGLSGTLANAAMAFPQVVYNDGNKLDPQVVISTTAPAGWQVIFIADSSGSPVSNGTTNLLGTGNTGLSSAGGATSTTLSMPSNSVTPFWVVYVPSSATNTIQVMTPINSVVTATGQNGGGTGADTNNTWDVLLASFISMTKSATVTTTNCPSNVTGIPGLGVCPGGTIQYAVTVTNLSPGGGTNEPANAYATLKTGTSFTITDDGGATIGGYTPNNWATYTNGVQTALVDPLGGTTQYGPAGGPYNNSFQPAKYFAWQDVITNASTVSAFQPSLGKTTATLTFTVVVK